MIVLANVQKLYDGTGTDEGAVRRHVDVRIERGRVVAVDAHDPAGAGEAAARVDASGLIVTPGLVDCHSHVTIHGVTDEHLAEVNGLAGLLIVERILWRTLVDGGVTTARDVGGATHLVKRLVDDGTLIGPRLKIAVALLSTTAGHGDFRSTDRCHDAVSALWPPGPGRPSGIVDGPWECRKRVRELAGCGADLVKICASPGVLSPGDALEHRDLSGEEIAAIVDEAEGRGLRVAAHAHSRAGIDLAIRHGVHDLQHVSFLDQELASRAAEAGCTVTPTSWVTAALQEAEGLSPFVMEKAREVQRRHAEATRHARAAGLTILAGTDPVVPGMHGRNWLEIVHLHREGLPLLDAWHAMTGRAAAGVGQPDAGTIAPGQRADLLLWKADVVSDADALAEGALVEVLKDGVAHRGALPELPQRTFRDSVSRVLG